MKKTAARERALRAWGRGGSLRLHFLRARRRRARRAAMAHYSWSEGPLAQWYERTYA